MSLCEARVNELTVLASSRGHKTRRRRTRYILLRWQSYTCVRQHQKRPSLTSFMRDGLEEATVGSDKRTTAIKSTLIEPKRGDTGIGAHHTREQVLSLVKLPAAREIVQLLSAWDTLSEKLTPEAFECNGLQLLLAALKFAVPVFQRHPFSEEGRFQLSRALEVAYILADLHMDAETIAAGILRVAADTKSTPQFDTLQRELGSGTVSLLHDCLRVNQLPRHLDSLDGENASLLRQFSLAYHEVRAMVVELALRLDGMRHISSLPKHRQQALAVENMQLYAPLAHALGLGSFSQELEDVAFRVLFPDSYKYVENWLQSHWGDGEDIISDSIKLLKEALEGDVELQAMARSVSITGRRKSRFSTMKKLLKDGRRPEQVFDILGLRVILFPKDGDEEEVGVRACYRAQAIVAKLWREVPGRMKDYIARPKQNGYSSLHLAIYLTDYGPWNLPLEIQIRTSAMHAHAVGGTASHALYKGGLTDPRQVEHFKTAMLAAAKAAAYRLQNDQVPEASVDHIFKMFDKNNDGIISRKEFQDVFLELGRDKTDASQILKLLDANTDGVLSADELEELKQQVRTSREFVEESILNARKIEDMNKCGKNREAKQFDTIQLPVF